MAILKPLLSKIWGSAASGTDLESPDDAKYASGWVFGEKPPNGWMNWLHYTFSKAFAHLNEHGILEWDNVTAYPAGAYVWYAGKVYKARVANTDQSPVLPSKWQEQSLPDMPIEGNGNILYYKDSKLFWKAGEPIIESVDTIADLGGIDVSVTTTVNVRGYTSANDGGGDIFNYDATQLAVNDGVNIFNGWVRQVSQYSDARNANVALIDKVGIVSPQLQTYASDNDIFVDNLRQVNFHEAGASDGQFAFQIPDNKFRVHEASRSLPKSIGACEKILFVGDSLTAINDENSYVNQIARRMTSLKNGLKEIGYMAYESTVISAKQNNFDIQLTHSQFTDFASSAPAYSSDERKFSPDGKGFTITAADGTPFIYLTMNNRELVKYDTFKLYYLIQPNGGTFDVRARGDATATTVDTSGTLGLGAVEVTPNFNGALEQYDLWVENVNGDVTVYGVDFKDSTSSGGYSYDTFAISGGALWELIQLDYTALNSYLNYRQPDTVVINIGTNDSSQGRTVAEFIADLTTYVQRIENALSALYAVNIVIVTPNNMQWTNFPGINLHSEFEDARRKFARDFDYMYIDIPSEIGNFNHAWVNGWMKDGTHPNAKGLDVIGSMIGDKLISNMTPTVFSNPYPTPKTSLARFDVASGSITNLITNGKITGVTYTDVGNYNVTHSIGTDEFIAIATAGTANRSVAINGQSSASITLDYRGGDGSLQDGRVYLMIEEF